MFFSLGLFVLCIPFVSCSSSWDPLKQSLHHLEQKTKLNYEQIRQGDRNPTIEMGEESDTDESDDREVDALFKEARDTMDPEVTNEDLSKMVPTGKFFADEERAWQRYSIEAWNFGKKTKMNISTVIHEIGFWLRDHKFMETKDPRYCEEEFKNKLVSESVRVQVCGDKLKSASYQQHFPLPRLKRENSKLRLACRQGLLPCIDEIQTKLFNTSFHYDGNGFMSQTERLFGYDGLFEEIVYRPFQSHLQWFQYRVTASYYMCYYTLTSHPLLKRFGRPCIREVFELGRHLRRMNDYRMKDENDFDCALLSFCPDPCCGAIPSTNPGVDPPGQAYEAAVCHIAPTNPCVHVADGSCHLEPKRNLDFQMLKRNFLNFTCDCRREHKGLNLKWEMSLMRCVDVDECGETETPCPHKREVCVNTYGSFFCACRMEFVRHQGECVRKSLHRVSNDVALRPYDGRQKPVIQSGPTLSSRIQDYLLKVAKFFGLALPPEIQDIHNKPHTAS